MCIGWRSRRDALDDLELNTSRGFTDQELLDRTGIVHMNGRIYDAQLGRFLQPDPLVVSPGFSQSYNRNAYVLNAPWSFTDPSGFAPCTENFSCDEFSDGSFLPIPSVKKDRGLLGLIRDQFEDNSIDRFRQPFQRRFFEEGMSDSEVELENQEFDDVSIRNAILLFQRDGFERAFNEAQIQLVNAFGDLNRGGQHQPLTLGVLILEDNGDFTLGPVGRGALQGRSGSIFGSREVKGEVVAIVVRASQTPSEQVLENRIGLSGPLRTGAPCLYCII